MAFQITVRESIPVGNVGIDLRQYLKDLESLYLRWHPTHQYFKFIRKNPTLEGSSFWFKERIAGVPISVRGIITQCSQSGIMWESQSKLIRVMGSIRVVGETATQEVFYRLPSMFYALGKLLGRVVTKEQLATHVREELKQMVAMIGVSGTKQSHPLAS